MTDQPATVTLHEDVWLTRDRPVLMAFADWVNSGKLGGATSAQLAEATGLGAREVTLAGNNLVRGGYIQGKRTSSPTMMLFTDITERALTETGLWPSSTDVVDRLLWVLEQRIAEAPADQRSRLVKARDGVVGMGRDLAVEVLGAAVTGRLPL